MRRYRMRARRRAGMGRESHSRLTPDWRGNWEGLSGYASHTMGRRQNRRRSTGVDQAGRRSTAMPRSKLALPSKRRISEVGNVPVSCRRKRPAQQTENLVTTLSSTRGLSTTRSRSKSAGDSVR